MIPVGDHGTIPAEMSNRKLELFEHGNCDLACPSLAWRKIRCHIAPILEVASLPVFLHVAGRKSICALAVAGLVVFKGFL